MHRFCAGPVGRSVWRRLCCLNDMVKGTRKPVCSQYPVMVAQVSIIEDFIYGISDSDFLTHLSCNTLPFNKMLFRDLITEAGESRDAVAEVGDPLDPSEARLQTAQAH